jgi:hypothetical protein
MCFRRKSANKPVEETKKNFDIQNKITTFDELMGELQINSPQGLEQMEARKEAFMNMPEWKKPNKNNLKKLKIEADKLMQAMIGQVEVMSKGLRTMILINTYIEETVAAYKIPR